MELEEFVIRLREIIPKIFPRSRKIKTVEDGQRYQNELTSMQNDAIKEAIYISGNDNCCCPRCWPLDGTVWGTNPTKRPLIPRHSSCRCCYVPKMKTWADFGFKNIPEYEHVERPFVLRGLLKSDGTVSLKGPRGGDASKKIISVVKSSGTMEDWIKTLQPQIQRQFFATELAFQLWRSGKIKAFDLIDPDTYELRSDEELSRLFT